MAAAPGIIASRQATIDRAIALIDANLTDAGPSAELARWLTSTHIRDHLKADPSALRDSLAGADRR